MNVLYVFCMLTLGFVWKFTLREEFSIAIAQYRHTTCTPQPTCTSQQRTVFLRRHISCYSVICSYQLVRLSTLCTQKYNTLNLPFSHAKDFHGLNATSKTTVSLDCPFSLLQDDRGHRTIPHTQIKLSLIGSSCWWVVMGIQTRLPPQPHATVASTQAGLIVGLAPYNCEALEETRRANTKRLPISEVRQLPLVPQFGPVMHPLATSCFLQVNKILRMQCVPFFAILSHPQSPWRGSGKRTI